MIAVSNLKLRPGEPEDRLRILAAKALRILEPFDVLLNRAAAMSITSRSVLSPGIKRAISLTSTMLHPHAAKNQNFVKHAQRLLVINLSFKYKAIYCSSKGSNNPKPQGYANN